MKKKLALLVAWILMGSALACGRGDSILGVYVGTKATMEGSVLPMEEIFEEGATSLELKSGGRCLLWLGGEKMPGTWTQEDEELVLLIDEEEYYARLSQGVIEGEIEGVYLTFVKKGLEGKGPEAYEEDRYYCAVADKTEATGVELDLLAMTVYGLDPWEACLSLYIDGTGDLLWNEEYHYFSWTGRDFFMDDGTAGEYWFLDDRIQLSYGGHLLTFALEEQVEAALSGEEEPEVIWGEDPRPDALPAEPPAPGSAVSPLSGEPADYWVGDWYGFWYIDPVGRTGDYVDWGEYRWDCCAHIGYDEEENIFLFTLWEEDGDPENMSFFTDVEVQFMPGASSVGKFYSVDGYFWEQDLSGGAWTVDPAVGQFSAYDHLIVISSPYSDGDGTFTYYIVLRPWGMSWEDVPVSGFPGRPNYYADWYLPLIRSGGLCPLDFS